MAEKYSNESKTENELHLLGFQVFYREDLNEEERSILGILKHKDFLFELAGKANVLDNLGIGFRGQIRNPRDLASHLARRVEVSRQEFQEMVSALKLESSAVLKIRGSKTEIFSYLPDGESNFVKIAESFAKIVRRTSLAEYLPSNILLLPDLGDITPGGFPANAKTITELDSTYVFATAFTQKEHRIPGTDNLTATIIHEWGHKFMSTGVNRVFEEWLKVGDWRPVEWMVFQTETPEKCLNDYARLSPYEDFCDCLAAFFLNPKYLERVSGEKYAMIEKLLKGIPEEQTKSQFSLDALEQPKPRFPAKFPYVLVLKTDS